MKYNFGYSKKGVLDTPMFRALRAHPLLGIINDVSRLTARRKPNKILEDGCHVRDGNQPYHGGNCFCTDKIKVEMRLLK